MAKNVQSAFADGITPQAFVASMTKNREKFEEWGERFAWKNAADESFFRSFAGQAEPLRCLIIAADWCGDVVRNVPVVLNVMKTAGIETRMLPMEEHFNVIDQFLVMGGRSIPVVLLIDSAGDVRAQWGPRPAYVQEPMVEFKQRGLERGSAEYDEAMKATRSEIMRRYGDGTEYQQWIVEELRETMAALLTV